MTCPIKPEHRCEDCGDHAFGRSAAPSAVRNRPCHQGIAEHRKHGTTVARRKQRSMLYAANVLPSLSSALGGVVSYGMPSVTASR